jgi:sec1 family domain-containing protein 1
MVARKLCKMIAEHPTLLQQNKKSTGSRPLLVILDRNADLITPIQHCSTYQALIDDVLQHKANRVEFETITDKTAKRPKKIQKKYDLDPDEDPFYAAHKFQPFPEAIEENGSELQEVTNREQAIRSKTTIGGPDPLGGANDLVNAVDSLPALLERKKQLEVHTSILQAVMDEVAARDVPQFFELEYKLATGSYKNDTAKAKKDVLALISDAAKGSVSDKVRLILVFALATGAKPAALDDVCGALQQAATTDPAKVTSGIKAVNYIKQLRSMHMLPSATDMLQELQAPEADKKGSTLTSFMAKATTQATGLLAKATDRVSSMLGKAHKNHATVVVENLCDMKPGSEDETYLYLDPKVRGDVDVNKLHVMNRAPVREAIAFVVGGGCYSEYQNLQQMVANERRKVCYGSTEIVDPETFVAQMGQLGSS